jgi:hypothetical protein
LNSLTFKPHDDSFGCEKSCDFIHTHFSGGSAVIEVKDCQCGLCAHDGENDSNQVTLIQIRLKHEAPETLVEECGHPRHTPLHMVATPISGCRWFEPVAVMSGDYSAVRKSCHSERSEESRGSSNRRLVTPRFLLRRNDTRSARRANQASPGSS